MPAIDERHRPRVWEDVAGNVKRVKLCRRLAERVAQTGDPDVVLISGPSGIGKSTVAALMIETVGVHPTRLTVIESGQCSIDTLRQLSADYRHSSLFGAPALLIEEVNTAKERAVQFLLTFLETLPKGSIVVMTSNLDPGELFAGVYNGPLTRRAHCIEFSTEGLRTSKGKIGPGAARVRDVLHSEGLDGKPDSYYENLMKKHNNNIGRAIVDGADKAMMED